MEMLTVECPKCKGSLQVNQDLEKIFCMYCRAEVILEKSGATTATGNSLLERGMILVEHGDFEKAKEVFDKAAEIEPRNAKIYLGMLLADLKITEESLLKEQIIPLTQNPHYQKSTRFADSTLKERLETYNQAIIERIENKQIKVAQEKEAQRVEDVAARQKRIDGMRKMAGINVLVKQRLGTKHKWNLVLISGAVTLILCLLTIGEANGAGEFIGFVFSSMFMSVFLTGIYHLVKVNATKKQIKQEIMIEML